MWLPLVRPLLGTWHATQACAVTGNQTSNHLVRRPAFSPLSFTMREDWEEPRSQQYLQPTREK